MSPTPAASPVAASSDASANDLPVTLPVLDALFADESFASDVKSKLQLTDEQVSRLRNVAHKETANLRETETGTTTAATAHAAEQITSVIGEEKTNQLVAFVRERWNNGGEKGTESAAATTSNKPNAVPADTRIVVNIPAYRMDVFDHGHLNKSYKIGIGYPEFPLPTGMRKARTIIFNPTWTPPDEPWVEAGKSKVKVGEKIEAGSALNPLGPIKIPIGSPSLIHGGKSPAKLGGFASHGCVGLTSPQVQDFAVVLAGLSGSKLTNEDVANYAQNKTETKSVTLTNAVPVELRYETIVVQDGKLHIYRDVYDKGTNTEENVRRVLDAYGVSLDQLNEHERAQVMDALDKMARDASGKPIAANGASNANAASENKNAKKQDETQNPHITRAVKGQKEIVIEITALAGKGYPAPVGGGFDNGSGAKKTAATSPNKRRR